MGSLIVDVSILFLVLALSRTVLVLDGVLEFHGVGRIVYRISSWFRGIRSSALENLETLDDPAAREAHSNGTDSRRASRWLHTMLVMMHVFGCSAIAAATWEHNMRRRSDRECYAAYMMFYFSVILFQSALVLFLLAKSRVTTIPGSRTASWERAIPPFCLLFAWVYKPISGVIMLLTYRGGVSEEGDECTHGTEDMSAAGRRQASIRYLINQVILLFELVLLLALFLKPLAVSGQVHNQSALVVYRRVFVRNAVCTAVIMVVLVAMAIYGYAALSSANETESTRHAFDISLMLHVLLTLYITEITIHFGCRSFYKTCTEARGIKSGTSLNHGRHARTRGTVASNDSPVMVAPAHGISTTSITV